MRLSFVLVLIFFLSFESWSFGSADNILKTDSLFLRADSCAQVLNYDCAIEHYQKALQFKERDSTLSRYIQIQNLIGDVLYKQGYFSEANNSYQLVLLYADEEEFVAEKAKALMGKSHILWRYGENVESIQNILESIDLFRSLYDTANLVSASNILGGIYLSTGEIAKASEIYEETLQIALASQDSIGMASSFEYKGVIHFFQNNLQEAIRYYQKSLKINNLIGNEVDAGITYGNIGEAYMRMDDFNNALQYFKVAEDILLKHNFNSGLIFVNYSAGESYMHLGQYQKAHEMFDKSLELIDLTGEFRERSTVLRLKSECFAKQGAFDKAFLIHQSYAEAKDSLNATNQNEKLMQIMSQYEFAQKEQENAFLQSENQTKEKQLIANQSIIRLQYIIGGILSLFLLVVIYLFFKLYKNKVLLDKSNRTKNKLFGFIAHDIKAPLGNLQMLIHLLEEHKSMDDNEKSRLLMELGNCTNTVSQLTDDLISWSVAQQDGLQFHPENVVLGEVVKDSLELFLPQIEMKAIEVENSIEPYVQVYVDRKALMSIVRNVISNAVKFSKSGGKIKLSATEIFDEKSGRDMIEFKCKDEGVGMLKEKVKLLITSNKIESTRGTSNEKGNGLGLNLVKEFVIRSNGFLKIKSKPDQGTRFSIVLPGAKE